MPRCTAATIAAVALAICASCRRDTIYQLETAEAAEAAMQEAAAAQTAADYAKALDLFDSVALAHPLNALAHLQTAVILQDIMKDEATAIYHFRAYLRLRPASEKAPMVEERIELAKRRLAGLAAAATTQITDPEAEAAAAELAAAKIAELETELKQQTELIEKIDDERIRLAERIEILERENTRLHKYMDMAGVVETAPTRDLSPDSRPLTYEVRQGDTLWSIAQKLYLDGARSTEILEINSDKIRAGAALIPGTVLVMPQH